MSDAQPKHLTNTFEVRNASSRVYRPAVVTERGHSFAEPMIKLRVRRVLFTWVLHAFLVRQWLRPASRFSFFETGF